MRSVAEHLNLCLLAVGPLEELAVNLADAAGCVLAEDIVAERDLPGADLAGRDGYAVAAGDIATRSVPFDLPVMGEVRAGDVNPMHLVPGAAVKIASGAPLPGGADTVIPIESTDRGEVHVQVLQNARPRSGVRVQASDTAAGQVLLEAGQRLGARQIGLLAALGRGRVMVQPRPRVVIISIGDELVEPGARRSPGQVYDANGHALACAAAEVDAATFRVAAVPDERGALRETLEDQLVRADIVITTGGLSYGSSDTVKEVLAPLGSVRFDNVAISPGRQLGVGKIGEGHLGEGTPIFCLPGDPVAAQVAFESFVRPALRKMAGWSNLYRTSVAAEIHGEGWESPVGRRQFVPVRLSGAPQGGYHATPCGVPGSLSKSALAMANAFAVVPEEQTQVKPGDRLHCMVLDR